MSQLISHHPRTAPIEPAERRWTRDEYYRLSEDGFFTGQRVELIEGRIIQMPPQGLPHTQAVELVENFAREAFSKGYRFRVQMPFRVADDSQPEPDLAVVPGSPRDPSDGHPAQAALIVEVSDTTLAHDRRKAKLYALSGIADYWIVNLLADCLEVHRDPRNPTPGEAAPYSEVRVLNRDDSIAPLAAPHAIIKVADLLP